MTNDMVHEVVQTLENWFKATGRCIIATSGGIDSMVLAYIASNTLKDQAVIAHSTSVSVPTLDAKRVRQYADKFQWQLALVQAGELDNDTYRANPVNRCYYCKSCLFSQLKKLPQGGAIITGTNLDDLGDFRPGLKAAAEQGVLQPYVELSINKATIREIAKFLQLDDLKDIPASPCLSSRIETGVGIDARYLEAVDNVENYIRNTLKTDIVRFRVRKDKLVLELSSVKLEQLSIHQKLLLINDVKPFIETLPIPQIIEFANYQQGSAFIHVEAAG